MSRRAHCFWELIFRGERGLFVCRVKETVAAAPKQLMARVLVLSLSHSHWGRAPDGLAWPQAPGQRVTQGVCRVGEKGQEMTALLLSTINSKPTSDHQSQETHTLLPRSSLWNPTQVTSAEVALLSFPCKLPA